MIAIDTNVLARFYCEDPDDGEARRQSPAARKVMLESPSIFVPLTAILELEWVMRGFYELPPDSFCAVVNHLLGMPHVTVERWEAVQESLERHRQGLDFADTLHWACSMNCSGFLTFDKKFARRAAKLGLLPPVMLPASG